MIASYFKTARRVITRNRAFSIINIVGLAASMSVGLLFITILGDIFAYDQFHEKSGRILRITTNNVENGQDISLATTSIALGHEITDHVPEAEVVTTIGYGFGGDFTGESKVQPLKGFWAQSSFFDVFSFPLLKGDPATALAEPHTMVITESAAIRLFGTTDVLGKNLTRGNDDPERNPDFVITGVMKDVPRFSHLQFEALGSFVSQNAENPAMSDWGSIWGNYTYIVRREQTAPEQIQQALDRIAERRNTGDGQISFGMQPITKITFFSQRLENQHGPTMPTRFLWLISSLTVVVLIIACFNYTNLSVARASTRMREVGVRKVIGARRRQVMFQFIAESIVIAQLALLFAFAIFTLIRSQFMGLTPNMSLLFDLKLTPILVLVFVTFAIVTGVVSGIAPGMYFSKVNAISVLRGFGGVKGGRIGVKRALIVVQYVFALVFITSTVILYKQYRDFVNFDLGFNTSNVINISLRGNSADVLVSKLTGLPEVQEVSQSLMVTSIGNNYYTHVKGASPHDSLRSWYNRIDERYLDVFDFKLLAGRNFVRREAGIPESEVIVNKQLVRQLNIAGGDPEKAVGETVTIERTKLTIVGVTEDFHYSTLDRQIGPFVFRQLDKARVVNVRISSPEYPATMSKIDQVWRSVDDVHPLEAVLYDHQIEFAYREYSSIGKVVGFLAFLTVIICSLGLLGMVIFAAETRMKEMSIRRVMGARTWNVTYLLSRNFLVLLIISAGIAIPLTWFFFTNIVLANVVYHTPIGFTELFAGAFVVATVALTMVISQGLRVVRRNPADVLRNE